MRQILENYFVMVDREALAALGVVVLLPLALLLWAVQAAARVTKATRERAGRWLIVKAVGWMPRESVVREQIKGLFRDRRGYERYIGWCELTGAPSLSFDAWRNELARFTWLTRKMTVVR